MIEQVKPVDGNTLELLRRQDQEAFAGLVEETSTSIYNLLRRILNDDQDAEDVLQETYIKAFAALPSFEGRSSLKTWLFRIATNEALMLIRKRKPQAAVVEIDREEESLESPQEIVDWCCLPESEMMNTETRKKMNEAVQHLPVGLRTTFILRDVEGLSGEETASVMGISVDNVKTRLLRARLKLREELSAYFGERLNDASKTN